MYLPVCFQSMSNPWEVVIGNDKLSNNLFLVRGPSFGPSLFSTLIHETLMDNKENSSTFQLTMTNIRLSTYVTTMGLLLLLVAPPSGEAKPCFQNLWFNRGSFNINGCRVSPFDLRRCAEGKSHLRAFNYCLFAAVSLNSSGKTKNILMNSVLNKIQEEKAVIKGDFE